tara:strand:+ start:1014 stop:1733 length:720 start_codon:yes stop_codon:yes gene_type:complete
MTPDSIKKTKSWYEKNYKAYGLDAQRRYPNEEFLRFMGRNFFSIPIKNRNNIRILELGCGSCANLWVVSKEGFLAYGIDLSQQAIMLGDLIMKEWGSTDYILKPGSMIEIPFDDSYFDAVFDVFSSYCLVKKDFRLCLKDVCRVLKPGGLFFSFTPGKRSDSFKDIGNSTLLDDSTLNGITRKDSPYPNNNYPFRFISESEYKEELEKFNFKVRYLESVNKTYNNFKENFEFISVEAKK